MLTIAYYFLQVILCSCLLMGYYLLVLRNKRFHQYNRFYLLAVAVVSWIVPLIKIRWTHPVINEDPQVLQLLSVVADNNTQIEKNIITQQGFHWSGYTVAAGVYILVATILFTAMLLAFFRIYRLLKLHSCKNVEDVYLILTKASGTPFSFFKYIFWNEEIDLRSESGKQILQHEITHVRQKHSVDKIFIQVMLIPGWFNPFFWLLKREMEMIHEFIADKKAVNNGDTASLAQMLLTAAYPQQRFAMTNPFFFSPIRRRLQMLTNNKNPRFSYLRRTIVLPLLAIVVILFSFRNKESRENLTLSVASVMESAISAVTSPKNASPEVAFVSVEAILNRNYTVVIDAGHGGVDKGMIGEDGTTESEITLQIAKKIKEINTNAHINIILRRDGDIRQSVNEIVAMTNEVKADLYVGLHTNGTVKGKSEDANGVELYIPSSQHAINYQGSQLLASLIAKDMEHEGQAIRGIKTRTNIRMVIDRIEVPGVLVEAGSIANPEQASKLKDDMYQKRFANSILNGINYYLGKSQKNEKSKVADTVIAEKKSDTTHPTVSFADGTLKLDYSSAPKISLDTVLIVIDGQIKLSADMRKLNTATIENVTILKADAATATYGSAGKNGAVVISTVSYSRERIKVEGQEIKSVPGRINVEGKRIKNDSLLQEVTIQGRKSVPPDLSKLLYMVDGVKIERKAMDSLYAENIRSVSVKKGSDAVVKYGDDAKDGVIEITTNGKPFRGNSGVVPAGTTYYRDAPTKSGEMGFTTRYTIQGYPLDTITKRRRIEEAEVSDTIKAYKRIEGRRIPFAKPDPDKIGPK